MSTARASLPDAKKGIVRRARLATDRASLIAQLHLNESSDWKRSTRSYIVRQFKRAVEQVAAYRSFVKKTGTRKEMVKTGADISRIPVMTKVNYLRTSAWEDLCVTGSLKSAPLVLTATSGSTGLPFYIPRTDAIHEQSMVFHRLFMERSGLDKSKPTLVIVAFGMGVWIGGVLTYEAFRRISESGWPVSLITPGVNKKEIFEALLHIGASYQQLVLCGYPPFVKDVIDGAPEYGINWKSWDMRVVCAAETFSEYFREHLMKQTGMKDPYRSVMNIYGSAELGTMATETPLTILIRRLAFEHKPLYAKLFHDAHLFPTVAQFIPQFVSFEAGDQGRLYVTGGEALPFVRYDIGDQGGVFTFDDVVQVSREVGIDLLAEARRARITDTIMRLPFVYLYERSDLSTKLYGAIIYPEHVKRGLQRPQLERVITGRFTMTTENDKDHNEYLALNFELKKGVRSGSRIKKALIASIVKSLSDSSAEYRYLLGSIHDKVIPKVVFWPHEHPTYFAPGIKQKWVLRV